MKQQSVGRHIAPLGHIIMIPSHPVFLLNDVSLAKKPQIPYSPMLRSERGLVPWPTALEVSMITKMF